MKVYQLIEALQSFPLEADVRICFDSGFGKRDLDVIVIRKDGDVLVGEDGDMEYYDAY